MSQYSLDTKKKLLQYLLQYITENKRNKFENIILNRTRHLTVVLEDIYQSHNASAVLRTCDCFGIQDVHIIENKNKYNINPDVTLGSSKWLNLIKYNAQEHNTLECYNKLKKQGYKIIATTPHKNDCSIEELNLTNKVALVFGTELLGLTDIAIKNADGYLKIPMFGFTESFNISVSAALFLFSLTEKLRKSDINWQLSKEERIDIKINWVKNVIKMGELLEKKFISEL